jgi:hypothetical protein
MPEVNHLDRCMFEAEGQLWSIREALQVIEHSGAWADRIHKVRKEVEAIASEMRDYNDQFEVNDD